jgi:hypothetical protein
MITKIWINILVVCCLAACGVKRAEPNIIGLWSVVEEDSLYYEIALTTDRYLAYTDAGGIVTGKFISRRDTLEFKSDDGPSLMVSKIRWWNDDEFAATNSYPNLPTVYNYEKRIVHTKNKRIASDIDLEKLITSDSVVFAQYFEGYLRRKGEYYSEQFKK